MSFDQLGLAEPILRAVTGQGYTTPTPIQAKAIPLVLAGHDVLGCAQTGTGKTAAFALPILDRLMRHGSPSRDRRRPVRVLVLAPTRELASQISQSFADYGQHTTLKQTVICGGVSQRPQVADLQRGVDILIATPGRLVDLIQQGVVDLRSVEVFVLDEADRMLDMGFLPDLRRVIARLPAKRQTVFFSATMPGAIAELAEQILHEPSRVHIAPVKVTADLIEQSVCFVLKQQKSRLLAELLDAPDVARAIVFTRTKRGADRVTEQLGRSGIRAEAMHGNKSQGARQRALANFATNRTRVLVATDLAARGIDIDGISHVFNFDLPLEAETYVHRIGRTGRAGASGAAISFCTDEERSSLRGIERLLGRALSVDKASPNAAPRSLEPPSRPTAKSLSAWKRSSRPRHARSGRGAPRPRASAPGGR
jgi:ATP-dependent RNA helicase RhlE